MAKLRISGHYYGVDAFDNLVVRVADDSKMYSQLLLISSKNPGLSPLNGEFLKIKIKGISKDTWKKYEVGDPIVATALFKSYSFIGEKGRVKGWYLQYIVDWKSLEISQI